MSRKTQFRVGDKVVIHGLDAKPCGTGVIEYIEDGTAYVKCETGPYKGKQEAFYLFWLTKA